MLAGNAQRLAREKLEDVPGARRFRDGLGQRLALFARQKPSKLFEFAADRIERFGAPRDIRLRPFAERGAGGAGLTCIDAHVFTDRLFQIRRILRQPDGRARLPATVQVVLEKRRDVGFAFHRPGRGRATHE